MIFDLSKLPDSPELSAQVCIIGAGVAGQAVAARLAAANIDVVLIESGGTDFDSETQKLAEGRNIGETYYDLETTRLRLYGGTAAIWGGRCAELDAIDFEKRDYIPHSGWPITKADLDPYYDKAFKTLGLKRQQYTDLWTQTKGNKPPFDPAKLDPGFWSFDDNGERFTRTQNTGNARTLLNATVTEMDADEAGVIRAVTARSLNGKTANITAKTFVIASGTIETVRLLMGSVPSRPNGLGNEHDHLGRYFMEHPHARGGQILTPDYAKSLLALPRALRIQGRRYAGFLRPADALQREAGILNTSLSFAPRRHEGLQKDGLRAMKDKLKHDLPSTKFWRTSYKRLKGIGIKLREWTEPAPSVRKIHHAPDTFGLYAVIRAEQAPNPDSRITLSADTDALGQRRVDLDWRLSEIDKRSVRVLMETLGAEYQRLGWGKVEPAPWLYDEGEPWKIDPLISSHHIGGYHHMGGTRMSASAKDGVVDANCRVHASPNLYIASSSVFPTGGWANPTVTIMALAERLADHLIENNVKS
ncbi:MAG: GMC family oxidoreductase [Litorimonas sp.]